MSAFVVEFRNDIFGPFDTRAAADRWISAHVRTTVDPCEIATWYIAPLREPACQCAGLSHRDDCALWVLPL